MTLTPQFVGPTLTATGVVPGLGSGRQINFTQPTGAPGLYTVSVSGSGVTSSNTVTITILGPPSFTLSPVSGTRGASNFQVTITPVNTSFSSGTLANFGPGISVGGAAENTLGPVAVQGNGTAIATLTIAGAAALGARAVRVQDLDDVTLADAFTVTHPPLTLVTINPTSGPAGSSVSIAASGFLVNDTPTLTVTLTPNAGGSPIVVAGSAPGASANRQVNFTVPANTAPGVYTATVAGSGYVSSNSLQFTVTPPPSFTLSPTTAATGSTVQVIITPLNTAFPNDTTANFGPGISVGGAAEGAFGPVAVQLNGTAIATLTINAGATLGGRTVQVTGNDSISQTNAFTVFQRTLTLLTINPTAGPAGAAVSTTASGFIENETPTITATLTPNAGGTPVTAPTTIVGTTSNRTVNLTLPGSIPLGAYTVTLAGSGYISGNSLQFTVTNAPSFSLNPPSGIAGSTLQVVITGANTTLASGATANFGPGISVGGAAEGAAGPIAVQPNGTAIATLTINAGAAVGGRAVQVSSVDQITQSNAFTVLAAPSIVSVIPASGQQGETLSVTITGANTQFTSASTVSFGAGITVNSLVQNSNTSLTANITVQSGATIGQRNVVVTTNGSPVTAANAFSVTAGTPRIISVAPTSLQRGRSQAFTVTGEFTNFQQGVTTINAGAGVTVGTVTVTSPTSLTVVLSAASDATLGARTLIATTGSQVVSLANAYSVAAVGTNQLLTCTTNTGVPPLLRAEGFTELTGDILIFCTGGTLGETNNVNIQLFLNVPITSRLAGSQSEALLLVDELGIGVAPGATPAVYRATTGAGDNSLVWTNVAFQSPGAGNQRIIRITNVRANVTSLAASASLVPSQVFAFISVSPSQSLPLGQAQQTVGFVLPGLAFSVTNCNGSGIASPSFAQCVAENSSGNANLINGTAGSMQFGLRFTEGFQTAFKIQIAANQNPSTPGLVYNTESGFLRTQEFPFSVGGADTGTRLVARFNNVPSGVRLFVTTRPSFGSTAGLNAVLVQTGPNAAGGTSAQAGAPVGIAGTATLTCPAVSGDGVSAAEIQVVNNSAMAVWEVTGANPAVLESAVFGVAVAYAPDTPNQRPGLGAASVSGNFGPFYAATSDAGRMSSSLPIPRFVDAPVNATAFRIDSCRTNLLFPFVTNQAGFDTGIAVSNTSSDPFGSPQRQQAGACTVNYYGSAPGGPAPPPQTTSSPVASGSHMAFVLSSGGSHGMSATPGFQGYLIVQCDFRYGHGFAFITDGPIGSARVAEGYLGLVMDSAISTRGSASETLSH